MLKSDWPRQHSGAVHGMLAIVTRPSFPGGLARETTQSTEMSVNLSLSGKRWQCRIRHCRNKQRRAGSLTQRQIERQRTGEINYNIRHLCTIVTARRARNAHVLWVTSGLERGDRSMSVHTSRAHEGAW